jgi:hypothetical protein
LVARASEHVFGKLGEVLSRVFAVDCGCVQDHLSDQITHFSGAAFAVPDVGSVVVDELFHRLGESALQVGQVLNGVLKTVRLRPSDGRVTGLRGRSSVVCLGSLGSGIGLSVRVVASSEVETCVGSDLLWQASGLTGGVFRFAADIMRNVWFERVELEVD